MLQDLYFKEYGLKEIDQISIDSKNDNTTRLLCEKIISFCFHKPRVHYNEYKKDRMQIDRLKIACLFPNMIHLKFYGDKQVTDAALYTFSRYYTNLKSLVLSDYVFSDIGLLVILQMNRLYGNYSSILFYL